MSNNNISQRDEQHYNDRQCLRKYVAIDGHIRPLRGSKSLVKIMDVSETGFRMTSPINFDLSVHIFLTIPGFQSLEAQIRWHRDDAYGCTFVNPLHYAILEHIGHRFAKQSDHLR